MPRIIERVGNQDSLEGLLVFVVVGLLAHVIGGAADVGWRAEKKREREREGLGARNAGRSGKMREADYGS